MHTDPTGWDFTDAWVLTAATVASPPCSLTDLVAAADGINHAVLSEAEVNRAVGRLSGSGLMEATAELEFRLTPAGAALVADRHGDLFSQVEIVRTALASIPVRDAFFALPAGAMHVAVDTYRHP